MAKNVQKESKIAIGLDISVKSLYIQLIAMTNYKALQLNRDENLGKIAKSLGRANVYPQDFVEAVFDNLATDYQVNARLFQIAKEIYTTSPQKREDSTR